MWSSPTSTLLTYHGVCNCERMQVNWHEMPQLSHISAPAVTGNDPWVIGPGGMYKIEAVELIFQKLMFNNCKIKGFD